MDEFTVQARSDSETFKSTDLSSSDERGKKKAKVLRKPKRLRRKKKNLASKKSKSPKMDEGWSVAIKSSSQSSSQGNIFSEATEEPFSSEKSDTLVNPLTSDDDTDDCSYKNTQIGDIIKSVSKNTKKVENESKLNSSERGDTPMPEVIKSVSKHLNKATRGSKLNSSLERVHIQSPDELMMIVENNGPRLTFRTDTLKKKNRESSTTPKLSSTSKDKHKGDFTSSNGKNHSLKIDESSTSSSEPLQDSQNSSKKKQNERAKSFININRQSRLQKPSPIPDMAQNSSTEDECDNENYAIVSSNIKTQQSKIQNKSLSQHKLTPKENVEFDNEEMVTNKSLRRQTRNMTNSTIKQRDMDKDLFANKATNLDQNHLKARSPIKYVSDRFADSDSESENEDSNSAVDKETNETFDKKHDNSESDSDTSDNSIIADNKVSSVLVEDNKQSIHTKQDKSPIYDKTKNSSREMDRKSNKITHSTNNIISECIANNSDNMDSSSSDDSTIKQKRDGSVILLNSELSIISLSDDSTKDITLKNTPILKLKPGSTSTEIKKGRRTNSIVQNNSKIQKQSGESMHEIDEISALNETFTSENPIAAALKEFKFEKNEIWTDPKSHTFCGADIAPPEDEKRETYNLESSVIDLVALKSLEDNEQRSLKRSSIGQRIAKRNKQVPLEKLSTTLKAKGKLKDKKSHISKQLVKGVLNESKKNVTFNGTISSKIKPTKMPNFSKIHQQQLDRSESLVDYVQRKQERSQHLLSTGKSLGARKSATPKPSTAAACKQLSFTPQAGCSYWNDSTVKSEKTKMNNKKLIRSDAFEYDTDEKNHPQKKRVTYSSPFEENVKPPKVFAKTPGKPKYISETPSIDTPKTENKLPCKSPRVNKTQGKTFMNLTPQKKSADGVVVKSEKTPKRVSPKTVKTPKRVSPKAVKTPKRVSPKAVKTPKRVSPQVTKTPKRVSPKSEKKMVLVKSPKSPITKLVPLKLFPSTSSSSQTKTNCSKKVLVNVVASKNSKNVLNKQVPKKVNQIPRQIRKENDLNVNNVGQQPSTSSAMGGVVKENMKHQKTVGVVNEDTTKASNSPKKKVKTRLDKEALKMAANKSRVVQTEDVEQKREVLKGMRSNRRFDLLMKFRNKK
nr:muscle M-line assembly protein unc-89-like [Onthophagus taurus]